MFHKQTSSDETAGDPLLREAAQWLAQAELGTLDEAAFARWRDADPRRALAFARVVDASQRAAEAARGGRGTARSPALSRRGLIAASVGAVTVGGGALVAVRASAREEASTPVGGLRRISLAHAGELLLNTDSAASWRDGRGGLQLWLERGEVGLDVVAGAALVDLKGGEGGARLAPGSYNARLRGGALDLTILRGEAKTGRSAGAIRGPHALMLTADRALVRPLSTDEVAATLAWRSGEILFLDETLAGAVEEYNRHLARKIVIADRGLGGLRIGGRFAADDPSAFLRALELTMGVQVTASPQTILLSHKTT